jgi:hypothetical protein
MSTKASAARIAAVTLAVIIADPRTVDASIGEHPLAEQCELFGVAGVEDPSSALCMRCHGSGVASAGSNHPVDMDYAQAVTRSRGTLRPVGEVVARGLILPDGQIRCLTCHDGRSPWKYGIALPPGTAARPGVNPRDPTTYEDGPALRRREVELATSTERYSLEVSPKPLCLGCHSFD